MTLRLPRDLWGVYRQPPQFRFGTVTSVSPGICTVRVAGGEIPVIYFKNAAPSVGDFVSVQRQSVVSYLMTAPVAGALWFSDTNGGVWRSDTSGNARWIELGDFPYGSGSSATIACVLGPDQTVYVPDRGAAGVWLVKADGSYAFVSIPGASLWYGCLGPDGAVWVADSTVGLRRIAADGTYTTVAVPSATIAQAPVTGSDGAIWLTWQTGSVLNGGITRVPLSGAQTAYTFSSGAYQSVPEIPVLGPDGSVYVPNENAGGYWVVPPSGDITYLSASVVDYAGALGSSCIGPDGGVWMPGGPSNDQIVAVSASGSGTELQMPSTAAPAGITTGPDKNFWTADANNPWLWRVTLAGVVTQFVITAPVVGGLPILNGICQGP